MRHPPIDSELLSHLKTEFGSHGHRAVEFLFTASQLLSCVEQTPDDAPPRVAETIAYCLREAMTAILKSQQSQGTSWGTISRQVVKAKRRYEQAQRYPGTDEQVALADLLHRVDAMAEFHSQQRVHERSLLAVVLDRTGSAPLSDHAAKYQQLVSDVGSGLHRTVTVEQATELWSACVDLLGRLFLPPDIRLQRLDALACKNDPTQDDVATVKGLLVTPTHLRHFLGRIGTRVWLDRLTVDGILDAPDGAEVWPVFGPVGRLARQDPDAVVDWLTTMYGRIPKAPKWASVLGRAALDVGEAALPLVLRIVRSQPDCADMVHLAWNAAQIANPSGELLESLAHLVFNQQSSSLGPTFGEMAERLVSGADTGNAERRIKLLCYKLRSTPPDDLSRKDREMLRDGSIVERLDSDFDDRFEVLLQALTKLARRVQCERWMDTQSLVALTDRLPGLIGQRMRVWLLSNAADVNLAVLVDEVARAIAHRNPTADDQKLIRRVAREADDSQYIRSWRAALGTAPKVEDVGRALAADERREEWIRAYFWSPLLPGVSFGDWSDVITVLAAKYGPLSAEYLSAERPEITGGWVGSPLSHEELGTLQPLEAASKIAQWRPGGDLLVSASELARTLEKVVSDNSGEWTREPVAVAMRLRHPTYIQHYLRAVAGALRSASIPLDKLISLLALVRTHPWEAVPLGHSDFDYDRDWSQVDRATIDVIKALADSDIHFDQRSEEVWTMLAADVENRSQPSGIIGGVRDPLDLAINRPCTRALDALLACMACEFRKTKSVRLQALRLLEQTLRLDGDDGLQFRAIMAHRIGFLHHIAPGWVEDRRGILLGAEAPDGLGQKTLDQALKWGRPNRWLLEAFADGVRDAACREVRNALDHLLAAMFGKLSGYDLPQVEAFLGSRPKLLAQAGHTMRRLLSHDGVNADHVELARNLWDRALAKKRDPDGLKGFGWLAEAKMLDDCSWAELTVKTLERTGGRIDGFDRVAKRALRSTPSRTTLSIMDRLVRGADVYERYMVERDAGRLIARSTGLADTDEYQRLRTALLERGVELDPPTPERSA